MAITRLTGIRPSILEWAIGRAGFDKQRAFLVFPELEKWLSGEKNPTYSQLENFSKKFHVPFGFLFLDTPPVEELPFPMFRGDAGKSNHFDLNVYDTVINVRRRQFC